MMKQVAVAFLLVASSLANVPSIAQEVRVTEEGQQVIFDGYTWRRRELAKRLPLDQPWPAEDRLAGIFMQFGLDTIAVAEHIKVPLKLLAGIYLVGNAPNLTYLIDCGPDGVALIDPGLSANFDSIVANVEKLGYSRRHIRWVLNTHAHVDHSMADALFRKLGAQIMVGEADADAVEKGTRVTAFYLLPAAAQANYPRSKVDRRLSDGEELRLGTAVIDVIHTPGHTAGSVCFFMHLDNRNVLFSGDTLLYDHRLGNQETAYSNNRDYVASLEKLANFKLNLTDRVHWDVLLPGHGAIVMDRAYMDVDKGWRTVQIDLLEGDPVEALPFKTDSYRKMMFGRP